MNASSSTLFVFVLLPQIALNDVPIEVFPEAIIVSQTCLIFSKTDIFENIR